MRIVVVGGVAGGMSAAARARRLDEHAEIIVLERGTHVSFANCGLPYFVGGEIADPDALLVQTPERLRASLNLDIRVGHDVIGLDVDSRELTVRTSEGVTSLSYDALVLSPGARAVIPAIPGIDSDRVRTLRTIEDAHYLRSLADAGVRQALVIGAGFIGLEAAEVLAARGIATTVLQRGPQVLPQLDAEHAQLVLEELRRLGVQVRAETEVIEILPGTDADRVLFSDGAEREYDLILLAAGVRPDTGPFAAAGLRVEDDAIIVDERGRTSADSVWAVGDATLSVSAITGGRGPVALAGPANRAGRLVADNILRPATARAIPQPLGTAIIRVGAVTVALTGASRRALQRADIAFRTLHLHPNQHAGYFPGASQIHLSLHISEDGGRILGAQAVGADGVDKRIDVLATAIRAGLSVDDLIDLDLAYAPPYGQAKDAINFAGMLGANVLDGTLVLWDAHDLDEVRQGSLILDVRGSEEVASGMVPGALQIPHTQLRERLAEVREAAAGRPVRVMCASGVRSAIAHRVLAQHGFDSASLSGGMLTLRAVLGDRADEVLSDSSTPSQ
ncbi:pyridine nucleotide-disulfide oxidoreductase [Pseudoclavibacter sp. RFBJ3]|nr:pyridine nucleotide-disulfide oxidoreductase [Pseudoclavibacter sp. RFBJ5]PPF90423.1 pyridine nucleotide-disulfide oxidoreductase [Pseudoclavibacter sp. RFBJ3]PPG01145.1 pyridine nucleotide-disulfide oxidoreductase [Pseudoclavibacter sp. RFBH5]PPG26244.1 pyridine nucleotide-disulfide oxidoreductase [Pseudoclavibacter sp. RFBI4]